MPLYAKVDLHRRRRHHPGSVPTTAATASSYRGTIDGTHVFRSVAMDALVARPWQNVMIRYTIDSVTLPCNMVSSITLHPRCIGAQISGAAYK